MIKKESVIESPTVKNRELLNINDFSNLVVIRGKVYFNIPYPNIDQTNSISSTSPDGLKINLE